MSNLSIFEEFPKLSFSELQQLSEDDVSLCVDQAEAINICKHSLETRHASSCEIQKLWVDKLLKSYKAAELTAENWIEICTFLDDIYQQLIKATDVKEEVLKELGTWLSDCLKFVEWLGTVIKELTLGSVFIVMGYVLETVIGGLNFYKQWHKDKSLKEHLRDCLHIHNKILKLINDNLDNWSLNDETKFSYLTEVMTSLCVIGEQKLFGDFKVIVETWKVIAKVAAYCAKHRHLVDKNDTDGTRKWAVRPILFLCKEIEKSITLVYKQEAINQPVEQIEKYLRVTNFYAKLIHKLATQFPHDDFPVPDSFFKLYFLTRSPPAHLEDNKAGMLLEKYVFQMLKQVFELVYKNQTIFKAISEACLANSTFSNILDEFLRNILVYHDSDIVLKNASFFIASFERIFKDAEIFIDPMKYNNFIELYTALIILAEDPQLSKAVKSCILKSNSMVASAAAEVLILVSLNSCCNTVTFDELVEEFYFWRNCNHCFTPFTNNSRHLIIRRMMQHYYKLCKKHKDYKKDKLWNQYSDIQISAKNYRFFLSLQLTPEFYGENALLYLKEKLLKGVLESKQSFGRGACCFDSYYKMIVYLEILTTLDRYNLPTEFCNEIIDLIYKLANIDPQCLQDYQLFIKKVLILITKYPVALEEASLVSFLNHISSHSSIYIKLAPFLLVKFLFALKQNKNYSSLNISISKILSHVTAATRDPSSKDFRTVKKLFDKKRVQWMKPNETLLIYQNIQTNRPTVSHSCQDSRPTKRIRLSPPSANSSSASSLPTSSSEVQKIIHILLDQSQQLRNLSHQVQSNDFDNINSVIENLNFILNNTKE